MLKIQTPNGEDRVLLHSCCAPCSSAIIECLLANGIRPTVFYCNPNIYPQEEYEIRKQEAIRFVTSQNLDFIDADYDYTHWRNTMLGLENEPERGSRCLKCFTLRLTETARYASEHGFHQCGNGILLECLKLILATYATVPPGTPETGSVSDELDEGGGNGIDTDAQALVP